MGKTRKTKAKVPKVNPLGIPSVREMSLNDELSSEHPEGAIAIISDQLQSASVEEKMCGLQSMAFLSQNQQKAAAIIDSDIVKIAAPLLMDPNKNIRNAVAGALRSLSLCGVEVCENLVEQDVLTPLLELMNEYASAEWTPTIDHSVTHVEQLDQMSDTFLQAVNLVWNLCESTSIALEHFNQTNILESFIRYLDYKVFGIDIAVAVAQCLLVISEDNPVAWRILNHCSQALVLLLNVDSNEQSILLRTLAAAILSNVATLATAHINQIFSTLTVSLDVNHRELLGKLSSSLPLDVKENNGPVLEMCDDQMEEETDEEASLRRRRQDLPTELEIEIKQVGWLLEAQRVAAETITNLCSSEDDETSNLQDDDFSDAESVHDYDHDSNNSSGNIQNDKLPIEVLEPIKSLNIVEKLWQRGQPIAENVSDILRDNEKTLFRKVKTLRISSLLGLQNLCNVMTTEDLGGPTAIYSVWLDLGQQVFQGSQDESIIEASTALMRAALEHLRTNPELFQQMSESDLQMMLNGVQSCTEAEIRANWLRMLGMLGCLLNESLVKIIIDFILQQCFKEADVWTLSEATDALMDMFSDNDWNKICYELDLAQKTKELERLLKTKLKQQKRELAERYLAVCTVRTNLSRFTKYVDAEQKKYKP